MSADGNVTRPLGGGGALRMPALPWMSAAIARSSRRGVYSTIQPITPLPIIPVHKSSPDVGVQEKK